MQTIVNPNGTNTQNRLQKCAAIIIHYINDKYQIHYK